MRTYSNKIALVRNSRGIYCLDTSMGCESGLNQDKRGCYGDCYAVKSAKIYGYDFGKTVLRNFENESHKRKIVNQINNVKLDFVRIGCSGDPSENWQHCIEIIKAVQWVNKQIVVITKHWDNLTDKQLEYLSTVNLCVNTSVSALDKPELLNNSLEQYHRIKKYCKSVLRIVSCDFNLENETGHKLYLLQKELFKNEDTIDTIFRPDKNNPLVVLGVVNVKQGMFNGSKALMSKYNKKTYSGKCNNCKEMCGAEMSNPNYIYVKKRNLVKQIPIFAK